MNKLKSLLTPPPGWRTLATILNGAIIGFVLYAMYASNAVSYLGDNPKTCVNCHVMSPEYLTWYHSAHREVATCNDCHVPHDNLVRKYMFKAKDGARHAYVYTMRKEPQTIFIKEEGKNVVQENCVRCHEKLIKNYDLMLATSSYFDHFTDRRCWECHRETPHGRVNSLSSVNYLQIPSPESIIPEWMKKK